MGTVRCIFTEKGLGNPSSNSELIVCVHFHINGLGKGMVLSLLSPNMG